MTIKQLLRYVGSKTQLLESITTQVAQIEHEKFEWIEPFCGSIVVPLHFINDRRITHFHLNDINSNLIRFFRELQKIEHIEPIVEYMQGLIGHFEKDRSYYYTLRDDINHAEDMNSIEYISTFLFINRTCFNGVSRYNSKGMYNVPVGKTNPKWVDVFGKLREVHEQLRYSFCPITFHNESYDSFVQKMTNRDIPRFIYCDPPYDDTFNMYNRILFVKDDQTDLSNALQRQSHPFLVHNTDTDKIRELYKQCQLHSVSTRRCVSRNVETRGVTTELMITNFPLKELPS